MTAFLDGVGIVLSELHWNDILDILIVAYIIFNLFIFIRDSRASLIFKGVLIISIAYAASVWLNLQMVTTIVELIVRYAAIAIIVVFQPEIRNVLERVGRSKLNVAPLFGRNEYEARKGETLNTISCVVESTRILQKLCMGALIVFEREVTLKEIIGTGTQMDAAPNVSLIANIFYNKAPLHDGAMIIRNNRICAASCILPLTQKTDIDPNFGTRHRAAIGMSENSDAVVVVVSEETGRISVASNNTITSTYDPGELSTKLMAYLLPGELEDHETENKSTLYRVSTAVSKFITNTRSKIKNKDSADAETSDAKEQSTEEKPEDKRSKPSEKKRRDGGGSDKKRGSGKGGKRA